MKKSTALLMAGTILVSGALASVKISADELDKSKLNSNIIVGQRVGDNVATADIKEDEISDSMVDDSKNLTEYILNLKGISESEREKLLNTEKEFKEENEKLDKIYDQIEEIYKDIFKGVDENNDEILAKKEEEAQKATEELRGQAEVIEKKLLDADNANMSIWDKVIEADSICE